MVGFRSYWKTTLILTACCVLVVASGCRRRPGGVQENPAEVTPVVQEAPPEPTPPPPPEPEPEPEPEMAPLPPLDIAIISSDDAPQYTAVLEALEATPDVNLTVYSLEGETARVNTTVQQIKDTEAENVVAIGLLAARATRGLESAKIVFCQVFNYQEHDLLSGRTQGIETIPDLGPAIEVWTGLDENLKRLGLITGAGQEERVARARESLASHGVELVHRVTRSDKETLVEFQRLLPEIDGYWMFPDNRILSSSTIHEIMALSRRARIGVLANDPGFHQVGALICASHDPVEIAACAHKVLDSARDSESLQGAKMKPLSKCAISIREDVATQLGYDTTGLEPGMLAR